MWWEHLWEQATETTWYKYSTAHSATVLLGWFFFSTSDPQGELHWLWFDIWPCFLFVVGYWAEDLRICHWLSSEFLSVVEYEFERRKWNTDRTSSAVLIRMEPNSNLDDQPQEKHEQLPQLNKQWKKKNNKMNNRTRVFKAFGFSYHYMSFYFKIQMKEQVVFCSHAAFTNQNACYSVLSPQF